MGTLKIVIFAIPHNYYTVGGIPTTKKRTYRSKKVNQVNGDQLKETLSGEEIAIAIEVAKEQQLAVLCNK